MSGHFNKPQLANHFDKGWTYICKGKAVMYEAEALLQQAFAHHQEKEHSKYVARLRAALRILDDHRKDLKLASADLQGHCKVRRPVVGSTRLLSARLTTFDCRAGCAGWMTFACMTRCMHALRTMPVRLWLVWVISAPLSKS